MLWRQKGIDEDAPKDAEILGWFQTLGPPPTRPASPYFRAQIRARIEEHCAHRGALAWVAWLRSPLWVSGLATGVLLMLGIWWSGADFGALGRPDQQADAPLGVYQFQRHVQQPQALGRVAVARRPGQDFAIGRGFTAVENRVLFFRLGTLYADALATLHSGTLEHTGPQLQAFTKSLERLQAPASLMAHLQELHSSVQGQRYPEEVIAKLLALFETLYVAEYTTQGNTAAVTLFQVGAWVENLSLAAAIGDQAALQQGQQGLTTFHSALVRLQAPSAVLEALTQLRQSLTRHPFTEAQVRAALMQLKAIQQHLGALAAE